MPLSRQDCRRRGQILRRNGGSAEEPAEEGLQWGSCGTSYCQSRFASLYRDYRVQSPACTVSASIYLVDVSCKNRVCHGIPWSRRKILKDIAQILHIDLKKQVQYHRRNVIEENAFMITINIIEILKKYKIILWVLNSSWNRMRLERKASKDTARILCITKKK